MQQPIAHDVVNVLAAPAQEAQVLDRRLGVLHELAYRATTAQCHAERRASRPKVAKLAANDRLRAYVHERLAGDVERPDAAITVSAVHTSSRHHGIP